VQARRVDVGERPIELPVSLAWFAIVCWLISRAVGQRRLFRPLDRCGPPPAETRGQVAIILPVRNEADNVAACVASLTAQSYPPSEVEIFVVDDHSADDTREIVARSAEHCARLQLLRSPPLPAQWIGKSHACWIGARAAPATAKWLCFIDADVRCEATLLACAINAATRGQIDLLSLAPRQELHSFAERLMLPCGLYLLAFYQDLGKRQSRDCTDTTVTGQFMLIRRDAYEAVGGHAAVHSEICEDLALARLIKRSGYKVALLSGGDLLSTRMYTGWQTLWLGLTKNLVDMLVGPGRTVAIAFVAVLLAWATLAIPLVDAATCAASGSCSALFVALAGSAAILALHLAGARHFRIPFWYGFLFPIGYTIGAVMAFDSVRRRMQGRVSWKGRTYP
jgi:chlorobactene glucosyltransferase